MRSSNLITFGILGFIVLIVGLYAYHTNRSAVRDGEVVLESEADRALSNSLDGAYTDLLGTELNLRQYDGQVRVVNSWASWCPFCVTELPDFAAAATAYKDQGVVVIAINRKESSRIANQFVATLRDVDDVIFVLDPADTFYKTVGGFTMPETLFYDTAGNVVVHKRGFMELSEIEAHINTALVASQ